MKKVFTCLFVLIIGATMSLAQPVLPVLENFENPGTWPWSPWSTAIAGTATKSASSAHSGTYGLHPGGAWQYRTDITLGNRGHIISLSKSPFSDERGLDKNQINRLMSCDYIN